MTYTVQTNFDNRIPSWAGNGSPFRLIACHDTEGGQGLSGAAGTIQFLIDAAYRGASYHEVWWYHENTDEFGVIKIVSPARAAGSIAPQVPPYYPTQWVKDSLGSGWWDPNQGVYAVSIAGRVADVDRYAQNPKFLAHAHRRMMEIWKELGLTRRAEHFQFQPGNRSDWGKLLTPALGGLVTKDTYAPPTTTAPEENMATVTPIPPTRMLIGTGATIRYRPDLSAGSAQFTLTKDSWVTAIGKATGEDFGAGPLWYAYVISSGGLRFFHAQDVKQSRELIDPALVDTDSSDEVAAAVAPLNATIAQQTAEIAGLMTELATAEQARQTAEEEATAARTSAAEALALKEALTDFMD